MYGGLNDRVATLTDKYASFHFCGSNNCENQKNAENRQVFELRF